MGVTLASNAHPVSPDSLYPSAILSASRPGLPKPCTSWHPVWPLPAWVSLVFPSFSPSSFPPPSSSSSSSLSCPCYLKSQSSTRKEPPLLDRDRMQLLLGIISILNSHNISMGVCSSLTVATGILSASGDAFSSWQSPGQLVLPCTQPDNGSWGFVHVDWWAARGSPPRWNGSF